MSSQHPGPPSAAGPSSKVPIPRLERRGEPSPRPGKTRDRVQRACLSCRARKVKCNGGQPQCTNCDENQAPCIYVSSRKDKLKTATEQNQDMIRLLKDLRERAGGADKIKIEEMLYAVVDDVFDASTTLIMPERPNTNNPEDERGEANISAEVGSNGDLDLLDEDLHKNEASRATGFIGKNSEIQWIRRLHYEADHGKEAPLHHDGPYGPPGKSAEAIAQRLKARKRRQEKDPHPLLLTSNCSFYLDDENVEMDFMVDPFELPVFEIAERLLRCFMDSVQDSFPILAQKTFIGQFYHHYTSLGRGTSPKLPQKWQAILNLVFAIGAAYSHLTEAEWRADERDHLVYHSRAWALSLKDPWWFAHPDLTQMQLTGLLAFYYLVVGQVNRSWLVVGMAVRLGYALGMHVRNEDPAASAVKKELLARVWWAFYSLDQILSAITGRPSVGLEKHSSVPLPLSLSTEELVEQTIISGRGLYSLYQLEVEPTNSGSYLKSTVTLGIITQKALIELYAPTIVRKSWESVQGIVAGLSEDLETWATSLPPGLSFFVKEPDQSHQRERFTLELYYQNTKILITRHCLRHVDRGIENQTKGSQGFDQRTAETCVNAARSISSILPNNIPHDRVLLYHGPWWSIVHNIMQALTILILEICYEAIKSPEGHQDIDPSLKKLVRWLRVMKTNNGMANRGYMIAMNLLQKLASHLKIDITDLLAEDLAVSAASSMFPYDQPTPQAYSPEYSRLAQEYTRHYLHNQRNPYNYALSNPFGLPQEHAQSSAQGGASSVFQDFYMNQSSYDSMFSNVFGNDLH